MSRNVPSARKMQAIEVLLTAPSLTAAAGVLKVNRRTLSRWLGDQDFQQELLLARRQLFAHASGRIVGLMNKSVDVVDAALSGKRVTKTKFLASKLTIHVAHLIQQDDLESRVAVLEGCLRERGTLIDRTRKSSASNSLKDG